MARGMGMHRPSRFVISQTCHHLSGINEEENMTDAGEKTYKAHEVLNMILMALGQQQQAMRSHAHPVTVLDPPQSQQPPVKPEDKRKKRKIMTTTPRQPLAFEEPAEPMKPTEPTEPTEPPEPPEPPEPAKYYYTCNIVSGGMPKRGNAVHVPGGCYSGQPRIKPLVPIDAARAREAKCRPCVRCFSTAASTVEREYLKKHLGEEEAAAEAKKQHSPAQLQWQSQHNDDSGYCHLHHENDEEETDTDKSVCDDDDDDTAENAEEKQVPFEAIPPGQSVDPRDVIIHELRQRIAQLEQQQERDKSTMTQ